MALEKEKFFEIMESQGQSLGFDNLNLLSGASDFVRECVENGSFDFDIDAIKAASEPDLGAPYTQHSYNKLPIVSAAMDTVTESETAVVMADNGGRGTLHAGLTPEKQFKELEKVKKRRSGFIENPKKLTDDMTFTEANNLVDQFHFTTFPVIGADDRLVGVVTGREIKFASHDEPITARMIPIERVHVLHAKVDFPEAYKIMRELDISTLPVIDEERRLTGMYTFTDVQSIVEENSGIRNVDSKGRYVCDIAVPTDNNALERVELCKPYLEDGGGIVVIDSADGDSAFAFYIIQKLREAFPGIDFMAGNVIRGESAVLLARMGMDGVKAGQAQGSACTTYEETGIGRGQITAVWDCVQALRKAGFEHIPVCSDGGVKKHGDVAKALAADASSVMIGTMLGATKEAPGEIKMLPGGRTGKVIRGMGSLAALQASAAARARYGGDIRNLPLPEGREEVVEDRGELAPILDAFRKALRKSMLYVGAVDIVDYQKRVLVEFNAASHS